MNGVNAFLMEELVEEVSQVLNMGPEVMVNILGDCELALTNWFHGACPLYTLAESFRFWSTSPCLALSELGVTNLVSFRF